MLSLGPSAAWAWMDDPQRPVRTYRTVDALVRALREAPCAVVFCDVSPLDRAIVDALRAASDALTVVCMVPGASVIPSFDGREGVWIARAPRDADELLSLADALVADAAPLDIRSSGVMSGRRFAIARHQQFSDALDAIAMWFQPIVSSARRATVAYEALLRCALPALPSPLAVIGEAVATDRVWDLGRVVRDRSAAAVPQLPEDALLFVNLHVHDIEDPWLLDERNPLAAIADRVVFELTEQANAAAIESLPRCVRALRERGFRLAIDDLGSGYSGLSVLAMVEPEFVKVDMSIVRDVDQSKTKQRVIRSMSLLAADLGATMICEGVETLREATALRELGVDWLQGYYFARPAPAFAPVSVECCWP